MQKKLRLGHIFNRKASFVYHFGKRTYKIFTLKGRKNRLAELRGNTQALTTDFWGSEVIKVDPFPFCLRMIRGEPLSLDEVQRAEEFVQLKLKQSLLYPVQSILSSFDFSLLRSLIKQGLDVSLIDQSEEILRSVYLPITSSHGDLHIGNMIYIGTEIKLIDWSMFNKKGSFVTDYIHFHNFRYAVLDCESWTKSILKEQSFLKKLAIDFNTTPNHLRLAYTISRISGEMLQEEDLSRIPLPHVKKYNTVLTHIINKFGKANVQRCNTLI